MLTVPLWAVGLLVGAVLVVLWRVLSGVFAAVVTGWEEATGSRIPAVEPAVVAQYVMAVAVVVIAVRVL